MAGTGDHGAVGSTKVVRLVAADFTVLDERTEPADTADLVLLGYAP